MTSRIYLAITINFPTRKALFQGRKLGRTEETLNSSKAILEVFMLFIGEAWGVQQATSFSSDISLQA